MRHVMIVMAMWYALDADGRVIGAAPNRSALREDRAAEVEGHDPWVYARELGQPVDPSTGMHRWMWGQDGMEADPDADAKIARAKRRRALRDQLRAKAIAREAEALIQSDPDAISQDDVNEFLDEVQSLADEVPLAPAGRDPVGGLLR